MTGLLFFAASAVVSILSLVIILMQESHARPLSHTGTAIYTYAMTTGMTGNGLGVRIQCLGVRHR